MGNAGRRLRATSAVAKDSCPGGTLSPSSLKALGRSLAETAAEEWRFVRNLLGSPRTTGAIAPSGGVMARKMASVADPASTLPVLEIGPGTGVMTRALVNFGIAPQRLWLVEYSEEFVKRLARDFPEANVIRGDAFDLDATLGEARGLTFDCVVSSLPLLSFPLERRVGLIEDLLARVPAGRPVVQFSYQPFPPVPAGKGAYEVEHFCDVLWNIPPARVWLYRKPAQGVSRPA